MRADLEAHLPEHIGRIREFQEYGAVGDIELDRIWAAIAQELKDYYAGTMSETECAARERMLDIQIMPGETLESRRRRLRGYYVSGLPYTEKKLEDVLTALCGGRDFTLTVQRDKCEVSIELRLAAKGLQENAEEIARKMLPANMLLKVSIQYNRWRRFAGMRWRDLRGETWGSLLADKKWQGGA